MGPAAQFTPLPVTSLPFTRKPNTRSRHTEVEKKSIWTSLLESTSSSRRVDERHLLILGGGVHAQNELLTHIAQEKKSVPQYRTNVRNQAQQRKPVHANRFALGYTYLDISDDDQDDLLCRLSVYMLPEAHPAFTSLIEPLLTPITIPETLAIIMLDWREPWNWMFQLRDRIKMIKAVLDSANAECQAAMEENMKEWSERRKGPATEDAIGKSTPAGMLASLGPGEWETPLGIPLSVVCFNVERINMLEVEYGWKDKEFDMVMQYLRTVLLTHGGSLIYISSSDPGSLQPLVWSSLGIQTMIRKTVLKRDVVQRDKVLIPPNWDTWGNIKAQADGFDPEPVSKGWSFDLGAFDQTEKSMPSPEVGHQGNDTTNYTPSPALDPNGAIILYEKSIDRARYPPYVDSLSLDIQVKQPILQCPDYQEFLMQQSERLQKYKQEEQMAKQERLARRRQRMSAYVNHGGPSLSQRLGPVQFNVSGVQVNAEEALEALQERVANRAAIEAEEEAAEEVNARSEEGRMRAFFESLKVESRKTRNDNDVL